MKLFINDRCGLLNADSKSRIESKIAASLAKFGSRVQRVVLTVQDVNGPKGGEDKECQLVVKLKRYEEFVASSKDVSLSQAVTTAIRKAERGVSRRVERANLEGRGRSSRLGFALYR